MKHSPDPRLDEAIHFAEAGESDQARELLTQIVIKDEENELAWLWLSRVVTNSEEMRICLENLLTLNPNHKEAEAQLAALNEASSIHVQRLSYQPESEYHDLWSDENALLCGFCAGLIDAQDERCPHCHQNLVGWVFNYEKPSNSLGVYQGLLALISLLLLLEAAVLMARGQSLGFMGHQILFGMGVAVVAVGLSWRRSWMHIVSIALLIYLLAVRLLVGLVFRVEGLTLDWIIDKAVRLNNLADWTISLTTAGQLVAILLALIIGIGVIPADFDRRYYRHIAKVGKGKKDAAGYYLTGRSYAQKGQWATAARYWQRAVAAAPAQISYHKALGEAYGKINLIERSTDTLRWARDNCHDADLRAEIEQSLTDVDSGDEPFGKG